MDQLTMCLIKTQCILRCPTWTPLSFPLVVVELGLAQRLEQTPVEGLPVLPHARQWQEIKAKVPIEGEVEDRKF